MQKYANWYASNAPSMNDPVQIAACWNQTHNTEASDARTPQTPEGSNTQQDAASPFPGLEARPRYVVLDDWTKSVEGNHRPGVYYCGLTARQKGFTTGTV
jgi:hypothetical protein